MGLLEITIKYFKLDVTPAYESKRPHDWFKAGLPGRGKPSRPAFPKSKAGLGPFKAGTVFNQSINQNK